ncbi:MAG: hypothetical protein IJ864_04640 [Alphaproteobacteria bacterium]|nr:hypothetical protein [Alphaproteobacteria bacterium]
MTKEEGFWNSTKDAAHHTWEKTKEVSGNVWEGTKEVSENIWDKTKEVSSDVWKGTKEAADNVKDFIVGEDRPIENQKKHCDTTSHQNVSKNSHHHSVH